MSSHRGDQICECTCGGDAQRPLVSGLKGVLDPGFHLVHDLKPSATQNRRRNQ